MRTNEDKTTVLSCDKSCSICRIIGETAEKVEAAKEWVETMVGEMKRKDGVVRFGPIRSISREEESQAISRPIEVPVRSKREERSRERKIEIPVVSYGERRVKYISSQSPEDARASVMEKLRDEKVFTFAILISICLVFLLGEGKFVYFLTRYTFCM